MVMGMGMVGCEWGGESGSAGDEWVGVGEVVLGGAKRWSWLGCFVTCGTAGRALRIGGMGRGDWERFKGKIRCQTCVRMYQGIFWVVSGTNASPGVERWLRRGYCGGGARGGANRRRRGWSSSDCYARSWVSDWTGADPIGCSALGGTVELSRGDVG